MEFDCLVVGTGFCGSVIARKLAEVLDKKVLILERRNQISGNMYDELDENGILVQKYGPHVFHTDSDEIYNFISKFTKLKPYTFKCAAEIDEKMVPSPFNFRTIDILFTMEKANEIKQELKLTYGEQKSVTIVEMLESDNQIVKEYAEFLFEKDYRLYTAKQWGIPPSQIDVSILKRVPVLLDYRDSFFNDKYEAMPEHGFTKLFESMLNHPNITIRLEQDANYYIKFDELNKKVYYDGQIADFPIIYTGMIDELLEYQFGKLPYRALWFDYRTLLQDRFLPETPIAVYPQKEGYTRITEYKILQQQEISGITKIALEYPMEYDRNSNKGNEPYYPVINEKNMGIYDKYKTMLQDYENFFVCGRLADYKYYNMDDAIQRAFDVYYNVQSFVTKRGKLYE